MRKIEFDDGFSSVNEPLDIDITAEQVRLDSEKFEETDVKDALESLADKDSSIQSQIEELGEDIGALEGDLSELDGEVSLLSSDFSNHTSDGSIHFSQAEIDITSSQISDFDTAVDNRADGRIAAASLNDLSDVNAGSPDPGQALVWDSDSSKWIPGEGGGDGSGLGEKNYIRNPSGKSNTDHWYSSDDTKITITREVGNLPEPSVGTCLLITPISGTDDYVATRFYVDPVDEGKVLKVSWQQYPDHEYEAGDLVAEVWDFADASADPRLLASKPIHSHIGEFFMTFPDGRYDKELRIRRAAGTKPLSISSVLVGPGTVMTGAAVGPWTAYTPTGDWATNTTYEGWWRRNGENMELSIKVTLSGGPSGSLSSITLPPGYTIDTTKLPSGATVAQNLGRVLIIDADAGSGGARYAGYTSLGVTTNTIRPVAFEEDVEGWVNDAGLNAVTPFTFASGDYIHFTATVPISEWSGSGVNILPPDIQSPDKAGFIQAYAGPTTPRGWAEADGSVYSVADYPDLYRNIGDTWATCINPTTGNAHSAPAEGFFRVPDLRGIFLRGVGTPAGLSAVTLGGYQADQNKSHRHIYTSSATAGDGQYIARGTAATSTRWTEYDGGDEARPRNVGVRYIIKLYDDVAGPAVGFSLATANEAGLVKGGQIPGTATNDSPAPGNVGEYLLAETTTPVTAAESGGFVNVAQLELPPGDWDISGGAVLINNGTTYTNTAEASIGTVSGSTGNRGNGTALTMAWITPPSSGLTPASRASCAITPRRVTVSSSGPVTYYLTAAAYYSGGGTPSWLGHIKARRVR